MTQPNIVTSRRFGIWCSWQRTDKLPPSKNKHEYCLRKKNNCNQPKETHGIQISVAQW